MIVVCIHLGMKSFVDQFVYIYNYMYWLFDVCHSFVVCCCVGGPNIILTEHQRRQASDARVDLLSGQSAVSGCLANPFIRVHGMYV